MEWLNHSQKRHCELCKTSFQFTKLYDPAMPKRLPVRHLLKRIGHDIRKGILLSMRWMLVTFVWLAWLPYCTRHIWRSSIRAGDSIPISASVPIANSTEAVLDPQSFLPFHLHTITSSEHVNRLILDIMEGQVITSVIIVIFVVVFLIREWIVQNNAVLLAESQGFLLADVPASPSVGSESPTLVNPAATTQHRDPHEPRTLIARQPHVEQEDQVILDTPANPESYQSVLHEELTTEESSSADAELIDHDVNPEDDTNISADALRLLRREAVLRATTQRWRAQASAHDAPIDVPASTLDLDQQLAKDGGHASVEEARAQAARQRNAERMLWEHSDELSGENYPDSPRPPPQSTDLLPEVEDLELQQQSSLPVQEDATALIAPAASEDDRDADSIQNTATINHDSLLTPDMRLFLEEIHQATDNEQRIRIANETIQRILDSTGLRTRDVPLDRADPAYREFMRSAGVVAMTANEYGINPALDLEQVNDMLAASTDGVSSNNVRESPTALAAQANRDIGLHQNQLRELQAAVVDAQNEAEALARPRALQNVNNDVDDDFEGLLELIGVRGPLVTLLQNSILVVVMISAFILFGICLPYIIGRAVLAITRNPQANLIDMPLSMYSSAQEKTSPWTASIHQALEFLTRQSRALKYAKIVIVKLIQYSIKLYSRFGLMVDQSRSSTGSWTPLISVHAFAARLLESANIPNHSLKGIIRANLLPDKIVSLLCGYLVCITVGSIYLKADRRVTSGEQGKQVELVLRAALRQAGFVIKFVAVLGVELVVFPFYCGVLLDIVFLPFFQQASIAGRLAFFSHFPFTGLFLHWLVGTIYMFNFALFVSMCREIVRPGVLFFIRDPNDPAFNPIKDILERPLRSQMRKIGISVMIYGGLILGAFGSVLLTVATCCQSLLPLSWGAGEPLFEIPFDLLLFQVLVPLTIRYVKPHQVLKSVWKQWFIATSKHLRLSSFMMGERVTREESRIEARSKLMQLIGAPRDASTSQRIIKDGTFRRVPNTDSIPIRKDRFMIMEVTEDDQLISSEDLDGDTDDDPNYTVVYTPPHFYLRIYLFLSAMWLFASFLGISSTILPLMFGRRIFRAISPQATNHDMFAYLYGIYAFGFALWALQLTVKGSRSMFTLLKSAHTLLESPGHVFQRIRELTMFTAKWVYLISTMSVLIPTLLGLCLETYLIVPLGMWYSQNYTPTIHLLHDWVVGLIYVKIFGRTAVMIPQSTLGQALGLIVRNDWRNGWRDPDIKAATFKLVLPLTASLLAALLLPLTIGAVGRHTLYREVSDDVALMVYRMSYPAALVSFLFLASLRGVQLLLQKWRASIRDSLYLQGQKLHNFGEVPAANGIRATQDPTTTTTTPSTHASDSVATPEIDAPEVENDIH